MRPLIALTLFGLSGCVTVPVVKQAADEKPLQGTNMTGSAPYALTQDCDRSNAAYEVVREALDKGGFQIIRAIPVKTFSDTSGYILHLDGNGYEVLKPYTTRVRGAPAQ